MKYKINDKYIVDAKSYRDAVKVARALDTAKVKDAPNDVDLQYEREFTQLESDVKKANDTFKKLKNKSFAEIFYELGYRNVDVNSFCKDNGPYTRMVEFHYWINSWEVRYYVAKDGIIPKGATVAKTKWYDSCTKDAIFKTEHCKISPADLGWTKAEVILKNGQKESDNRFYSVSEAKRWCYGKLAYEYGRDVANRELRDSVKDEIYKLSPWTGDRPAEHEKEVVNLTKQVLKELGKDPSTGKYDAVITAMVGLYGSRFMSSEWTEKIIRREVPLTLKRLELNDSVKDSDVEYLTEEEMKAVEDYKRAIANTTDPKMMELFAHILQEEIEHLEELRNSTVTQDTGESENYKGYTIVRGSSSYFIKRQGSDKAFYIKFASATEAKEYIDEHGPLSSSDFTLNL